MREESPAWMRQLQLSMDVSMMQSVVEKRKLRALRYERRRQKIQLMPTVGQEVAQLEEHRQSVCQRWTWRAPFAGNMLEAKQRDVSSTVEHDAW